MGRTKLYNIGVERASMSIAVHTRSALAGIAVDRNGNVYAAEGPIARADAGVGLTKYAKR